MKLRKMAEGVLEANRRTVEEEPEEDDDNATLQDCLDRQKKGTTVRSKRKVFPLTPLDDEECPSRNGKKKLKKILELLASDPFVAPRASPLPFSRSKTSPKHAKKDRQGMETCNGVYEEGKKRKVKKKRRRSVDYTVSDEGDNRTVPGEDAEFLFHAPGTTEDLTTSESSRKFFIRVAKVELADGRLGSPVAAAYDHQGSPGVVIPGISDYDTTREENFLPGDGYHTCGDSENCRKIPCLEQILNHLDKLSEEQLKLWYRAIMGEVFASRSGEKVRGRLRRMIKCRVKEIIKSECPDATVSSQSWKSSPAAVQLRRALSPSMKSVLTTDLIIDSPGSKLSASNAGDGSIETEDAVCSGSASFKRSSLDSVSSMSDISRELTFEVPTARNSCTKETSAASSVDDPEPAVPPISPRITRSKAKGLVKKNDTEQEDDQHDAHCLDGYQDMHHPNLDRDLEVPGCRPPLTMSDDPADFDAIGQSVKGASAQTASPSRSCGERLAVEKICKDVFSSGYEDLTCLVTEEEAEGPAVALSRSRKKNFVVEEDTLGGHLPSGDCNVIYLPAQSTVAGTTTVATRSRKKSSTDEKACREVHALAGLDHPDFLVDNALGEITAVATRSRKKSLAYKKLQVEVHGSEDVDLTEALMDSAGAEITAGATLSRNKSFADEKIRGEVHASEDVDLTEVLVDSAGAKIAAVATRSRKKSFVDEKIRGEVHVSEEVDLTEVLKDVAGAEITAVATRSRKKSFADEKIRGEVHAAEDVDLIEVLEASASAETTAVATRSRKKKDSLATGKILAGIVSSGDLNAINPPVEDVGAPGPELSSAAAIRARRKKLTVVSGMFLGQISSSAHCDVTVVPPDGTAAELATVVTRSRKKNPAVEKAIAEVPSSADCDPSDKPAECAAVEVTAGASRLRKKRAFETSEKALGEVSSPVDWDVPVSSLDPAVAKPRIAATIPSTGVGAVEKPENAFVAAEEVLSEVHPPADSVGPSVEAGAAAETTAVVTRSRRKCFFLEKAVGGVSASADGDRWAECVAAAETPAVAVRSTHKRKVERLVHSVAAEDVPGEVFTSAERNACGSAAEGAVGETTTLATRSCDKSLSVGQVLVEVSFQADCSVNGVRVEVGAGTTSVAFRSCKNRELITPEKVSEPQPQPQQATSARCDLKLNLAENSGSSKADQSSSKEREIVANQQVRGEVLLPSDLAPLNDGLHAPTEVTSRFQHAQEGEGDLGEGDEPSLSEVIMRLLSSFEGTSSCARSEVTDVAGQQSSGSVPHVGEAESFPNDTTFPVDGKVSPSTAVAPSTGAQSCIVKNLIVGPDDLCVERTPLRMPAKSRCESTVSNSEHDEVAEGTLMEVKSDSCAELRPKICTGKLSCPTARSPAEQASVRDLEGSSDLRCSESSVLIQPPPHGLGLTCTISDSSPVVCSVPSSGSDLKNTSGCKFNTECWEVPIIGDERCVQCGVEFPDEFADGDRESFLPTTVSSKYEEHVQVAIAELNLPDQRRFSECLNNDSEGSELSLFEIGDRMLFERLTAERVSKLWPVTDEKKKHLPTTYRQEPKDAGDAKLARGPGNAASCGSVRWQLLQCESGSSRQSAPESRGTFEISVPRVWRDAGEYLGRLDCVYMMLDSEECPSSFPVRKRKRRDSHADVTSVGSDDATFCDYGRRTKQCVDLVPAQTSCAEPEHHIIEADDLCQAGGDQEHVEQSEVKSGSSTCEDNHPAVNVEACAICDEVRDPPNIQHQDLSDLFDDEGQNGESVRDIETTTIQKETFSKEDCHETSSTERMIMSSQNPCTEDSFLVEPPPCDSLALPSTSDEEGSPELDTCIDLLAREQLVGGEYTEDCEQSAELLAGGKNEALRDDNFDDSPSPPTSLPPIRLKIPSGRARHIANALTESELIPTRDWRCSDARVVDPELRTPASLSPSSSDEDTAYCLREQDASVFESALTVDRSGHKMSLILSPISPKPALQPQPNDCSSRLLHGDISSPDVLIPPPCTPGCAKGILKTSSRCNECVKLRLQARTASDFVASQMKTFGEVAGRLAREIQDLRSILESQVSGAAERVQDDDAMEDTVKAISKSRDIEQSAEKNLSLLLRDCKRFCKLTAKRPQRRIVFADEAGKKLCHVKTFQAAPALARPLWDIP